MNRIFNVYKILILATLFSASLYMGGGVQSVDAAANIYWKTTKVMLNGGAVKISGYFHNNGNSGGYVKELIFLNLTTTDANGNFIWSITDLHFGKANTSKDLKIYVSAYDNEYYTFTYLDSSIPNRGSVGCENDIRIIYSK